MKIEVVFLNETHLNSGQNFKLPNFPIYRNYRQSAGRTNCGGTAIIINHKIIYHPIQIPTKSIENTIIHLELNGQELRSGTIYKSPSKTLLYTDLDQLLNTSINTILTGDLKRKIPYDTVILQIRQGKPYKIIWNSTITW